MHTMFEFIKDGATYCAIGKNRFDAQLAVELAFHINLAGATWVEYYKNRKRRSGTV